MSSTASGTDEGTAWGVRATSAMVMETIVR